MQKVSRSIFTGLLVIAGLTACGDKVTVAPGGSSSAAAPAVHSVTVTPPSASVSVGQSVQLVASVNADATLARTVTWASTAASIATVSASGLVTAVGPGTVAITAASTADPTVVGAATIIVAPIQLATISIASIDQNGTPAPLTNPGVKGQLDVTLNVDQGTQTVTALNLIVHNNTTNTDTTVATYSFTSPQKVPAAGANASSAPITMSFNTAAFNATTGAVAFVNGSYGIRAQAVVAGTSQTPVTSTIAYAVANVDFLALTAKGDTTGNDINGLQWVAGHMNIGVIPVLYSGVALTSVTVSPPAPVIALPITLTTLPGTAAFAVGKDTITRNPYTATVTGVYANGQPFNGGVAVSAPTLRDDNQAPLAPTINQVKGGTSRWLPASYAFGAKASDYTAGADLGSPQSPGVGLGAPQFWVWPSGSFTALGGTKSGANCKTTGGQMVTSASALLQSLPADSTTYNMRALQFDKLGNVVCSDLTAAGNGTGAALTFGVDNTLPVNVKYSSAKAGTDTGSVNFMLLGTNKSYVSTAFQHFIPNGTDSISGFDATTSVIQTITVNDVTAPATTCAVGVSPSCTLASGINVAFPATGALADLGYYTVNSAVADRAGNSVALPTTILAVDNVPPAPSGGVAIPAALVGGTPVSFSGGLSDNMTLMTGGGSVTYGAPANITLNYDANATIAAAGTFGTLNKSATVTMNVPWLISDLQTDTVTANAGAVPGSFNIRGVDEVGLSGVSSVVPGPGIITTGPGTGGGTNGQWTQVNLTTFKDTATATTVNLSGTPTSTTLTATVTLPASVGLPFTQVCFFYQDQGAATTAPAPTFVTEYKLIGCVSTAATSDNTNWVYSFGAWTPPTAIAKYAAPILNTTNVVAIGYGANGHAFLTAPSATITVNP